MKTKDSMAGIKNIIAKYLRETAEKLDNDTSEISEAEAIDILRVIAHEVFSKEQACQYLNLKRSQFDALIREKKISKGKKILGYKELRWYKDELDIYLYKKSKNRL